MRRLTHDRVQPVSAAWALAMSLGTTARWLSTAYRSFDVDLSLTKPSREVHQPTLDVDPPAPPGRHTSSAPASCRTRKRTPRPSMANPHTPLCTTLLSSPNESEIIAA
jgi:hypothetical protein